MTDGIAKTNSSLEAMTAGFIGQLKKQNTSPKKKIAHFTSEYHIEYTRFSVVTLNYFEITKGYKYHVLEVFT